MSANGRPPVRAARRFFCKYCHLYPGVQISIYRNFSYKIVEKLENGTIGIVTLSKIGEPEGAIRFCVSSY
jgi:hypothetical protein